MDLHEIPDFFDIFSWKLLALIVGVCILRAWLKGTQCGQTESGKNKVAVVTGANCGIGKQIVRILNEKGAKVYMGCRSLEKGQAAVTELVRIGCTPDRLILLQLDLCSFESVRSFATAIRKSEQKIDILINNAGIMLYPKFKLTEDGHEMTWQTNYLGHFLLTDLLLPALKASKEESRVVNVSALAHFSASDFNLDNVDRREGWDSREAYSRSKLAQVMHARHLSNVLRREGCAVTVNACHPGLCYTRLARHTPFYTNKVLNFVVSPLAWFFLKTPKDGAQCPIYCAMSKHVNGVSGKYFSECKVKDPSELALDEKVCENLFNYSRKACSISKATGDD